MGRVGMRLEVEVEVEGCGGVGWVSGSDQQAR